MAFGFSAKTIYLAFAHNLTEVEWLKLPSLPENSLVWRLARLHINKKETSPSPLWSCYFLFNIFLHCIHSPLNALMSLGNKISHLRLFTGTVVHDKLLLYPCWWIFQKAHKDVTTEYILDVQSILIQFHVDVRPSLHLQPKYLNAQKIPPVSLVSQDLAEPVEFVRPDWKDLASSTSLDGVDEFFKCISAQWFLAT